MLPQRPSQTAFGCQNWLFIMAQAMVVVVMVIVEVFTWVVVPFAETGGLTGAKGTMIALIIKLVVMVELFMVGSSASSKASTLKVSSSVEASASKSSSRRDPTHVVAAKAHFKASVVASSKVFVEALASSSAASIPVPWI